MALVHAMARAAVRRDTLASRVIVLPTHQFAVTLMMVFCAVEKESVGVARVCVRTTPYEVAPTANCVQ